MTKNKLVFDIGQLIAKPIGTRESYSFDVPLDFNDQEIELKSNLSGKVDMMKVDEGILVNARQITAEVEPFCNRCLKKIPTKLTISSAERMFLKNEPKTIEDPADIYLIDMKHLKIDLKEMLRQEIILHFPIIPVCSTSCKGLQEFQTDEIEAHKPLAILKELVKTDNHGKASSTKKENHQKSH